MSQSFTRRARVAYYVAWLPMLALLAVLRVKVIMGGIELYVPDHWTIVITGSPTMGAFENKTRQRRPAEDVGAARLVIEGSVVMGGVEIKN